MGSGGVARITLNLCDQAQYNCITMGRSTGGASRHEKTSITEENGLEIDENPLQHTRHVAPEIRLEVDRVEHWPGPANQEVSLTVGNGSHCMACLFMCTAGNVTMTKRAVLISLNNGNNNRFALCLDEERLNWVRVCKGVWARGAATAGMGE